MKTQNTRIFVYFLLIKIAISLTSESTYKNTIKFVYFNERFEFLFAHSQITYFNNQLFPEMKVFSNPIRLPP